MMRRGFLYPFGVRRHLDQVNRLFADPGRVAAMTETLTARADDKKHPIRAIVLSDEDICMRRDLGALARFRDGFDVKVVFTLRRQDIWLESWYLQNVKWQWDSKLSHCRFDDFLQMRDAFHWIHYDSYVRHLEKLFGRENVILNLYEKQQMASGPIEMFCDSIGLTDRTGFGAPAHVNASYSPRISEFMRRLPLHEAKEPYRERLNLACAAVDRALTGGRRQTELMIPHAARAELMAEYAPGNRALAQRYFGRDALFLEPLPGPDVPLAQRALPADSDTLMRDYVWPLISAIIQDQQNQTGPAAAPGQNRKKSA